MNLFDGRLKVLSDTLKFEGTNFPEVDNKELELEDKSPSQSDPRVQDKSLASS